MSLSAALTLFLEEYPNATEQPFAGNPVAEFIRRVVPEAIEQVIGDDHRYFENVYGSIGKGYIEAHHLVPLSQLKGRRFALDPERDFAVLCANCHRMVHRSAYVSDVNAFRQQVLKHQAI